jgi:hypothetical protein
MKKFVISTEDQVSLDELVQDRLQTLGISGFRIVHALGYWQGGSELSAHIEIVGEDILLDDIRSLAETIKIKYKQQAVLVESYPVESYLI